MEKNFNIGLMDDYEIITHLVNVPLVIENSMNKLRENPIFAIDKMYNYHYAYGYITGQNKETNEHINLCLRRALSNNKVRMQKVEGLDDLKNLIAGLSLDELKTEMAGHLAKLSDLIALYIAVPIEEKPEPESKGLEGATFNKYFKKPEVIEEEEEEDNDSVDDEMIITYLKEQIKKYYKKYEKEKENFKNDGGNPNALTSYSKYKFEQYQMVYKSICGNYCKLYECTYMEKDPQTYNYLYSKLKKSHVINEIKKQIEEEEEDEIPTPKSDVAARGGAAGGEKTAREKFEEQSKEEE